jgi:hypothetical protein
MPENTDVAAIDMAFGLLQRGRGQSEEALGLLRAYDPDSSVLIGHLDAVEGYTEVFLADLFCSGIPLSTLDYNGDFTYRPGSTTDQVYTSAVTLFDSALVLAASNDSIANFARVGKGRALLALGNYVAAAQAVAPVPDKFRYALAFSAATASGSNTANRNFVFSDFGGQGATSPIELTLVDSEGGNGLPFLSSGDPRSRWIARGVTSQGQPLSAPVKYGLNGDSSIVVASAIEARLIQAEAALAVGDSSWLRILNALRTDGTQTGTQWNRGSGGVSGLAPLADPGTAVRRVNLLFHERGFWLYLTGQRQGDLRRLIRQYGRDPESVYPVGPYGTQGAYGTDVTAPIPTAERTSNPLFTGCFSRGA